MLGKGKGWHKLRSLRWKYLQKQKKEEEKPDICVVSELGLTFLFQNSMHSRPGEGKRINPSPLHGLDFLPLLYFLA